ATRNFCRISCNGFICKDWVRWVGRGAIVYVSRPQRALSCNMPSPPGILRARNVNALFPPQSQALPLHARRVGPEILQAIVGTRFPIEHVDDHIPVILDDPFADLVTLDGHTRIAAAAHGGIDFFREGMILAAAGAG